MKGAMTMTGTMRMVAFYVRVSTEEQRERQTITAQVEYAQKP